VGDVAHRRDELAVRGVELGLPHGSEALDDMAATRAGEPAPVSQLSYHFVILSALPFWSVRLPSRLKRRPNIFCLWTARRLDQFELDEPLLQRPVEGQLGSAVLGVEKDFGPALLRAPPEADGPCRDNEPKPPVEP